MNSVTTFNNNSTTCLTQECKNIAASILEYIDFNVDPCSDFYHYTCGSWIKNTVIEDDRTSIGTLENTSDVNTEVMKKILEGSYEDVYTSLFDSADGFHREDQMKADIQNFQTMQDYYNICMNISFIDSLGPTPIYRDIATIENDLFPVTESNQKFSEQYVKFISQTLSFFNRLGLPSFVSLNVDVDDKNPDMNTIFASQVSLGLPSQEYYQDPNNLDKYKKGLKDILYKVLGDYSKKNDKKLRKKISQKENFKLWTKEKVSDAVNRFVEFETQLANISLKNEDMQDPVKVYNPTKLEDFQNKYPLIDWTSILKSLITHDTIMPDTIVVATPDYYKKLNHLLSNAPLITLQEYFVITFVVSKVHILDNVSRDAFRKMSGEIYSGTSVEKPRWRTCVEYTSNVYSNSLGRYYTLKQFGSEKERIKAENILTSIHEAWLNRVPHINWLDKETKQKAIEKINLIKHKVGYSIISPDLRQPNSIKKYNEGLVVNQTSFYETENIVSMWYSKKMWKNVGQPIDKDEWFMSPQTVNAYYSPNTNEIAIPAGILQSPFYSGHFPDYLNYGGIGMVIGHELTHAFDSSGRKYDGHGNLIDWWTKSISTKFEENSKCFIDQYSKFNITGPDYKVINVNGKLTLGENLADNGGISASLTAYRKAVGNQKEVILPGLEHLSPEALFFINFARFWCSKERNETAVQMIFTDEHAPSQARVNGVVQNNEDFAKTFKCPSGSPMNPIKKCKMW